MKDGWRAKFVQECEATCTITHPFTPFIPSPSSCMPLPIPLPSPHVQLCIMNESADRADLSFCHGGGEGRWTVECPGTQRRERVPSTVHCLLTHSLQGQLSPSPAQPVCLFSPFFHSCVTWTHRNPPEPSELQLNSPEL